MAITKKRGQEVVRRCETSRRARSGAGLCSTSASTEGMVLASMCAPLDGVRSWEYHLREGISAAVHAPDMFYVNKYLRLIEDRLFP